MPPMQGSWDYGSEAFGLVNFVFGVLRPGVLEGLGFQVLQDFRLLCSDFSSARRKKNRISGPGFRAVSGLQV